MKKLFTTCCLMLFMSYAGLYAQLFSIYNINTSNFPEIKAKFIAIDKNGKRISDLKPEDIKLTENDIERKVTYTFCKEEKEQIPVSSVLTMDVSGSMGGDRQVICQEAANAWIDMLFQYKGECAITSFDNRSYLNQDFTDDPDVLKKSVKNLWGGGGTDYNAAFLTPLSGAIDVAKNGKYAKKVIIFLTDGSPNTEPDFKKIIEEANRYGINIYCVTLMFQAPKFMFDMSNSTGGVCYDFVNTLPQALEAYIKIYYQSREGDPCEMTWTSQKNCDYERNVKGIIQAYDLTSQSYYSLPQENIAHFELSETMYFFDNACPGSKYEKKFDIKCVGDNIKVDNIAIKDKSFSVSDYGGAPPPFEMSPGDRRTLIVTYAPGDSDLHSSDMNIVSNACMSSHIYLVGSCGSNIPKIASLHLIKPNGGEVLIAGTDTSITWEGLPPREKINIEFSTDSGKAWMPITNTADSLSYKWRVPDMPSQRCLMKIRKANAESEKTIWSSNVGSGALAWSPDNKNLAIVGALLINIVNASTGRTVRSIIDTSDTNTSSSGKPLSTVCWSPDGSNVAVSGHKNIISVWNVKSGALVRKIEYADLQAGVASLDWSPDSKYITGLTGDFCIWSASSGALERVVPNVMIYSWLKPRHMAAYQPAGSEYLSFMDSDSFSIDSMFTGSIRQMTGSADGSRLYYYKYNDTAEINKITVGIINIDSRKIEKEYKFDLNDYRINLDLSIIGSGSDAFLLYYKTIKATTEYKTYIYDCAKNAETDSLEAFNKSMMNWGGVSGDRKFIGLFASDGLYIYDRIGKRFTLNIKNTSLSSTPRFSWNQAGDKFISVNNTTLYEVTDDINVTSILKSLKCMEFTADGSKIVAISNDSYIYQFDPVTNRTLDSVFVAGIDSIYTYAWSADGNLLAYYKIMTDQGLKIYDVKNRVKYDIPLAKSKYPSSMCFSPDMRFLACSYQGSDSAIEVWDQSARVKAYELKGSRGFGNLAWSPAGNFIAAVPSLSSTEPIKVWDARSGTLIYQIVINKAIYMPLCLDWAPDESRLAIGYGGRIYIWDRKKNTIGDFVTDYYSALKWSPAGDRIVYDGYYKRGIYYSYFIRVASLDTYIQNDMSDSLWSIVSPLAVAKDIDMGTIAAGSVKDSLIAGFLANTGTYPVMVDSIRFAGADSASFGLVSGMPPFTIKAGTSHDVEFRFRPDAPGIKNATVNIFCRHKLIQYKIKGIATDKILFNFANTIDFGKVAVKTTKDSLARIMTNGSSKPFIIDSLYFPSASQEFVIYNSVKSFSVASMDSLVSKLGFTPLKKGRTGAIVMAKVEGIDKPFPVTLIGEGMEPCLERSVDYSRFYNDSTLYFAGSASIRDTVARLSRSVINDAGAMWLKNYRRIDKGFITNFTFRMLNGKDNDSPDGSVPGADGIAFVIQNNSASSLGTAGGGMGYNGIKNSIAVEIDNYSNDSTQIENFHDPNGNHVAIQTGYDKENTAVHGKASTIGLSSDIPVIRSDGTVYYGMIEYQGEPPLFRIWLDTTANFKEPVLERVLDVPSTINLKDGKYAYIGFTSATGKSCQDHDIITWTFCSYADNGTDVEERADEDITGLVIYPNPASAEVNIKYPVETAARVTIGLYNLLGERVAAINDSYREAGTYNASYSLTGLNEGAYYIKFTCGGTCVVRRINVVR